MVLFITPHFGQPISSLHLDHAHHMSLINHVTCMVELNLSFVTRQDRPPDVFNTFTPWQRLLLHLVFIQPQQYFNNTHCGCTGAYLLFPVSTLVNFCTMRSLLHAFSHASTFILSFFFQMAAILFDHALDRFQSKHSLPKDLFRSYKGLHFGDICYTPPQHSLLMQ